MRCSKFCVATVTLWCLAALLLAGCAKDESPASSASSKFKVAPKDRATSDDSKPLPVATSESALPNTDDEPPPPRSTKPASKGKGLSTEDLEAIGRGELPNDPEQLLDLIKVLEEPKLRGRTQQEQMRELAQIQQVRLAAAEKLMKSDIEDEQRHAAAQTKLHSLLLLSQLQDSKADAERVKFAKELLKDKYPPIVQLGRFSQFGFFVDEFFNDESVESGEPLVEKVKELLESDGTSRVTLQIVSQAAQVLERKGFRDDAAKVYKLAAEKFSQSEDKEVAAVAKQLRFKAEMVQVDFEKLLQDSMDGTDEDREKLKEGFAKLAEAGPDEALLQLATQAAIPYMEIGQHLDVAKSLVETLDKAFAESDDEDLKKRATELVKNARKRYALVGKELPITGVQADGSAFDWSPYKGKVVLLDFWATWCGPCLKEIPNIRENYETYKDRGFEVIGINIDEQDEDLKQFLSLQKLPWTTVVSDDPQGRGFETPLAVKCGVTGIPFIVLIGKDGKVDSIQLRGPALGKRLAQLLPDAESSDSPKSDAKAGDDKPEPKS